jgi:hypothetical protein
MDLPEVVSPEEFRTALGAYATGVTVVTAVGSGGHRAPHSYSPAGFEGFGRLSVHIHGISGSVSLWTKSSSPDKTAASHGKRNFFASSHDQGSDPFWSQS